MMQDTVGIFILGTAGCGKSTLTAAMANWMAEGGMPSQIVNLDPGADLTPYEADVDVRDWITLADVMEEYELGPNGAQIVAADMLAIYKNRIKASLDPTEGKYILFDTPGQMELFTFREASRDLVASLVPNSFLLYLIDPFNARTPSGFISQLMLSSLARLRFMVPSLEVLSKSDMTEPEYMEKLNDWQTYPEHLMDDMLEETRRNPTMSNEFGIGINKVIEDLGLASNIFPVSSANSVGIDKIYEVVQLTYGGGDDLSSRDPEVSEE
jgi:GTPase SAR1 family protein